MKMRSIAFMMAGVLAIALGLAWWYFAPQSPRVGPNTVTIASIIPLTGPAAEFGGYNREASELFVRDYNRAHPDGPRLRHVFQDSKSTARDGASAAQAIYLREQPVALQSQLSGVSMAVTPIAAEQNTLLFTVAGTGAAKDLYPYAFRNYPAPELTAEETAEYFLADQPTARVAILRINDEFGLSVADAFKRRLEVLGAPIVSEETFEKSATDFRAAVTKVLTSRPDVVYLVGFGNPLGRIILQLREQGFTGRILGGPEIAFGDVLGVAGDAAEGVSYLDLAFDVEADTEPTKTFVERYMAAFGRKPTAVSSVVYDGWGLIFEAIEIAQSTDTAAIAGALVQITDYDGVSGPLSVSPERDVVYPLAPRTIRDGTPVTSN